MSFLSSSEEKPALNYAALLIDMQSGFLDNALEDTRKKLFFAQKQVLRFCAEENIPVVVLEYEGKGKTVYDLQQKVDLVPTFLTLEKKSDDGFFRTSLDEQLHRWNATDLLVMGINASYCVLETCDSAVRKGYRLHTARDCIRNTCRCCPTKYDWYEKHSKLYQDSSELIEIVRRPFSSTSLVDQL
ncbi:cysteine hydrolase [Candidatus Woesearchaeota archaeon]|nr:cysteine hydrolase [Candidatus Woesearchaeota archaeon]